MNRTNVSTISSNTNNSHEDNKSTNVNDQNHNTICMITHVVCIESLSLTYPHMLPPRVAPRGSARPPCAQVL